MRNDLVLTPAMLGNDVSVARRARQQVREFLTSCEPLTAAAGAGPAQLPVDDVLLVVSELVTNAITHAASAPTVEVGCGGEPPRVRVAVSDNSPALPARRTPSEVLAGGRGLTIVDSVADRWGVSLHRGDGKTVWAEIGLHGPLSA